MKDFIWPSIIGLGAGLIIASGKPNAAANNEPTNREVLLSIEKEVKELKEIVKESYKK